MTLFVLAGTPRTGSNLLTHALASVGLGPVDEIFSRASLADAGVGAPTPDGLRAYLARRIEAGDGGATVGVKIFWHQVRGRGIETPIGELFTGRPRPVVFHLHRRDVPLQAVSILRAYASGRFARYVEGDNRRHLYQDAYWGPTGAAAAARLREQRGDLYDFGDLRRIIGHIESDNEAWHALYRSTGVPVHPVCYEDVAADLTGQVETMLGLIGVDREIAGDYRSPLGVQRDDLSYDLARRLREDLFAVGDLR